MEIEGLVAYFSATEGIIVLNIGENADVEEGMRFSIHEKEVVINDPMTGEYLGTVCREKVNIRIHSVMEKICIGQIYRFSPEDLHKCSPDRIEIGDVAKRIVKGQ